MDLPSNAFREYDIRGNSNRDLNDALVTAIGRAVATHLIRNRGVASPKVAVACDCRLSSPRIVQTLIQGLVQSGATVINVGEGPTPLLYFAAHHLGTDGAIMVTGSHNPPEDNGFKMMQGKGSLFGADIQKLKAFIQSDDFESGDGAARQDDIQDAYIANVKKGLRFAGGPTPKVVIDGGNGAAGPLAIKTFAALGIPIDPIYCDMDGTFPNHHPDPTVEKNLIDLKARVKETGASLGIAFDGDGDRIGAVDENGEVIWGDKLMILFSRAVLKEHKGATILGEVKCSETLFKDIEKNGGRAIMCKTGHSLIKSRMKEEKAVLAGEMSGHIFFADRYLGFDDAIYGAARLIELVAAAGMTPSQMLADVPPTFATPEIRLECPDDIKFDVVSKVRTHFEATHKVSALDGARIDFGHGAWGLCRASNTGPVIVLRFEADTPERRDEIRETVEAAVAQARQSIGT